MGADRIRNGDLAPSATIGNASVAKVSVLPGGNTSGTYALEVTDLAAAQTLASNTYGASTDLVGEGQLTIRFGSIDGTIFNEDVAQAAAVIDVLPTDTLADVASKISASGTGLAAYVAQSALGARLVVKGADGAEHAFVIEAAGASVTGAPAPGALDYLAWNPLIDAGERKATAADAAFLLDGVEMTSASNKVSGLPGGLVLTLTGKNIGAPTQIGFADKSTQITTMMGDFVAALNDITGSLAELAAPQGGDLGNDPGARALRRALADLSTKVVMPNAAPGAPQTLADLGLAFTRDGNFRLDTERLQTTLSTNLAATGAMFTTGLFGVFATVDSMSRNLTLRSDPGSLGGSIERYTAQIEGIETKLAKIAEQQENLREQLVKTFANTDRQVSASQSTLSFLRNQIDAWNSQRN